MLQSEYIFLSVGHFWDSHDITPKQEPLFLSDASSLALLRTPFGSELAVRSAAYLLSLPRACIALSLLPPFFSFPRSVHPKDDDKVRRQAKSTDRRIQSWLNVRTCCFKQSLYFSWSWSCCGVGSSLKRLPRACTDGGGEQKPAGSTGAEKIWMDCMQRSFIFSF